MKSHLEAVYEALGGDERDGLSIAEFLEQDYRMDAAAILRIPEAYELAPDDEECDGVVGLAKSVCGYKGVERIGREIWAWGDNGWMLIGFKFVPREGAERELAEDREARGGGPEDTSCVEGRQP